MKQYKTNEEYQQLNAIREWGINQNLNTRLNVNSNLSDRIEDYLNFIEWVN
jgi:hypothetical protein